jgi:hypothetical protein
MAGWLAFASGLLAADLSVKLADKEPPKELAEAIRQTLQTRAVQVLESNKPIYEFWFCKAVPAQSKPDSAPKALDAVKQTTLLGAATASGGMRDYKDNEVPAGVYTMRLGLQPSDGDHLGTSEYPYFVVLIPAQQDTTPTGITDYKPMVKASGKATASGHPVILSLRPVSTDPGAQPKLNEPVPEHQSVTVKAPAKVEGKEDKFELDFEIVFKGKGKT